MAYYQLDDGSVWTAKQYKRKWPGGKVPTPRQRRMLGIKTITKKQYEAAKKRGNPRKRDWSKERVTYYANVGPDAYHFSHTIQIFDKLKDAKAWIAKNKRASGVWAILRSEDTGYNRMSMSVSAASDDWTREMAEKYCKQVMRNPGPGETSYGVDPNAITRKMKPYKPTGKPKKSSTSKTRRMKSANPKHRRGSLTWARADVKDQIKRGSRGPFVIGHYTTGGMPRYEVKFGTKWAKAITQPSGRHLWYPEEVWVGEPKKRGKGLKAVKVESQIKKNPHDKSMFGEDEPDWLVYAKAPGMKRFQACDLGSGTTVGNLFYATRFPHSQEAKVDRIVAKLNKDNKRIKFEKRRS